ncbi:MAG: hypothetical protein RI998_666 [Pseudomonadota bacterium]|jgi:hypothetical protein
MVVLGVFGLRGQKHVWDVTQGRYSIAESDSQRYKKQPSPMSDGLVIKTGACEVRLDLCLRCDER